MPFIDTTDHFEFNEDKLAKNNIFNTDQLVCDIYCLQAGQMQKPHTHKGQAKFYYVPARLRHVHPGRENHGMSRRGCLLAARRENCTAWKTHRTET